MSTGRTKWFAIILLCLYSAAVAHHVGPHLHTGDEAATCGLCVLVFATVLAACAAVLVFRACLISVHLPLRPLLYMVELWRPRFVRGPPFSV